MKSTLYLVSIYSIFSFITGGFLIPTAYASSFFTVTSVSDFNSGVLSNVSIADAGGGDGNVANALGAETPDQSQITGTTAQVFDSAKWLAQTFTPAQSGLLSKVIISLRRQTGDNSSGNVTVEIRNSSGGNPGTAILASTSTAASALPTSQGDVAFNFSDIVAVSSGTQYAIIVYRSGTGDVDDYDWYRENSGSVDYSAGSRFQSTNSGNTWSSQTNDQRFSQYYRAYIISGNQSSAVLNTNSSAAKYSQISWNENLPAGADIIFEVRASDTNFIKTDLSPAWISLGSGDSPINLADALPNSYQYFQWRATLNGTATMTPTLMNVLATYNRPAALNAIGNKTADENSLLQFTVSGSDPDNDALVYSASNLPSGAAFDAGTQTFAWTPSYDQSGNYNVIFTISDGTLTDSENVAIDVGNVNRTPDLSAIGNKNVSENNTIYFTISAIDSDNDPLTYSASNLPSGSVFDASTRTFSWIPTYDQAGIYNNVHFEVTDGSSTDFENITITVSNTNRAPILNSIGSKMVDEGQNLNFTLSAGDPDSNTLSYSASNLPTGASLDSVTGIFSWTPDYSQSGSYTPTLRVCDNDTSSLCAEETITITVNNINRAPTLNSIGNKIADENSLLEFILSATDADGDSLNYSASNLPIGSAFSTTTGTFSWTPTYDQAGAYDNVHFEVTDGSATTNENITVTINNVNRGPALDSIGDKAGSENSALTFTLSGTDPDSDVLVYEATNLPTGASFSTTTKTFNWTPDYGQAGTYTNMHFSVTDDALSAGEDITLTISRTNRPPILTAIGGKSTDENQTLSFTVSGSDPDSDALTYSASNLPSGASFDAGTGTFSWKPNYDQSGNYPNIHFQISDGTLTDSEDIAIDVNNVNQDGGGMTGGGGGSLLSYNFGPSPVASASVQSPTPVNAENIFTAVIPPAPGEEANKPVALNAADQNSVTGGQASPTEASQTAAPSQENNTSLLSNVASLMNTQAIISAVKSAVSSVYQALGHLKNFFAAFFLSR